MQAPFVELVEDHGPDAGQGGIVLEHAGQDTLGHHFESRGRPDPGVVADTMTDEVAHPGSQLCGDPGGCGSGSDSSRLQHHDATVEPVRPEERRRNARRLAGAGRCVEDGAASRPERCDQLIEHTVHRQRLRSAHRSPVPPGRGSVVAKG